MSKDVMAPDSKKIPGAVKGYKPDPQVQKEVEDVLTKIRVRLLLNQPFWGTLICRLELVDASGWCPTAATDGRKFYYNVNFIRSLTAEELIFLFAHEVMHVAYNHMLRRSNRDPKMWNAAADYAINGELKECRIGSMPACGLYDKQFHDYDGNGQFSSTWASEKIYDWLQENAEKKGMSLETLDVHLDEGGDSGGGDGDGDGEGEDGQGGYRPGDANNGPSISAEELEKISDEMRDALIQAAEAEASQNGDGAGNVPAGVRRMIRDWTQPKIRWQDLLDNSIKTQIRADFTYLRPHRRGEGEGGIFFPGYDTEEAVRAHIAIDTSGSMSDQMLKEIMSEVRGIMSQFTQFELHVWTFDAQVYDKSYHIYTQENLDEINNFQLMGGGGTLFESNWAWMAENEIEPDILLLFTDGYPCDSWGDPNYCDVIFCIHGDYSKNLKAPYGLTVWYEDGKKD